MPSKDSLHAKLDEISAKIEATRREIELKHRLSDGHDLTSGELMARHKYLMEKLEEEAASLEAQDHRVSALEQDVITWINSIDLGLS